MWGGMDSMHYRVFSAVRLGPLKDIMPHFHVQLLHAVFFRVLKLSHNNLQIANFACNPL